MSDLDNVTHIPTELDRTREHWLRTATEWFRRTLHDACEVDLPDVRVSMGFGGRRYERGVAAVCYRRDRDPEGLNQIYISPEHENTVEVLISLGHELIHAALDNADGHGGQFAETAAAIGFDKPFTQTPASPGLRDELELLAIELGPFPHGKLTVRDDPTATTDPTSTSAGGSDRNRWLSFYCTDHDSPIRMSAKKAARCALVCLELKTDGTPCFKPLRRR